MEELVAVYNAFAAGRPSPLPAPALDDAEPPDPSGDRLQAAIEFWTARLAGARPVQLAGDFDRAPVDAKWRDRHLPGSPIGWLAVPRLSPALLAGIKAIMRQESLTLFELMLVPFMMLLKRGSGQDDICVFSARMNRSPEQFSVHGTRVNPVILRLQLPDARTFRAALREAGPMVEAANAHEQLTLLVIPDARGSDTYPPIQMAIPKIASSQLFRINFNYLPHPPAPVFDRLSATLEPTVPRIPDCQTPWDLVLYIVGEDGALLGYNRQLFTEPTARRFATDYVALLERVVANPDDPLSTLLAF
jgi:non-ribosomal peptide synthetase component F